MGLFRPHPGRDFIIITINSSLCNKTPAAERWKIPPARIPPHPQVIEQLPPCLIYHQWELPLSQFTGTPACCWTLTSIERFSDIAGDDGGRRARGFAGTRPPSQHALRAVNASVTAQRRATADFIRARGTGLKHKHTPLISPHYSGEMLFFCPL